MASHVGFLNCDDGMSHGLCAVQCAQQAVHKYTHTHTQCAQMLIFSMRFDQQVHINAHGFELSKWLTFIAIDFTAIVYNTWNSNDDDSCPSGGVKCRNDYNTHICTHQLAWTIDDHWLLNGPSKYTHIHFFSLHRRVAPIHTRKWYPSEILCSLISGFIESNFLTHQISVQM